MGAIATTVSYMESMSEADQEKVKNFAAYVAKKNSPDNPFAPLTREQVIADIKLSEQQLSEGKGVDAQAALDALGRKYGFI